MTETATFVKDNTATIRNGVDTTTMFATLDAIKAQPEIAKFQFRAHNRWLSGAYNRSTIKGGGPLVHRGRGVRAEPRPWRDVRQFTLSDSVRTRMNAAVALPPTIPGRDWVADRELFLV